MVLQSTTVFWSAILLMLAFPDISHGAHPLVTDDAGTQGAGKFLLEINGEHTRDKEDGTKEVGGEMSLSFTAGLDDSVDLVLGLSYEWTSVEECGTVTSEEDGISDALVEIKWRFFERKGLALSLKPGVTLPTGDEDRGLGNGRVSYSLFVIATREFERWALHTNIGYMRGEFALASDNETNRHDIWHASIAAEVGLTENLTVVGNVGIETDSDRTSDTPSAFALAGIIYPATETVDLDLGIKAGLTDAETDLSFLAGIAISF